MVNSSSGNPLYTESDGILNSTGPLTYLGLGGAIFYIVLMILVLLFLKKEKRKANRNKYIPLYLLIFLLIVLAMLRVVIPEINFISIIFAASLENI